MRHLFKYTLGLLALLFAVSSCKKNEIEEPSLDLSTASLTFTKAASDQTLNVQTNKDNWNAFVAGQSDWITLEQQGTSLRVKVTANTGGNERRSTIVVNAGGLQKQVSVSQSAGDAVLDLSKAELTFEAKGGTTPVSFGSNASGIKVEVTTGADWLSVGSVSQNSFAVTAKENTAKGSREGKVTLTLGTTIKELKVTQEGTAVYILPFLDKYPANYREVYNYEMSRGSALISVPDGLFNTTTYRFVTKSEVMPLIQYEFASATSPNFSKSSVLSLDPKLVEEPAFEEQLKKYGFVKGTPSGDRKTKLLVPYTNDKISLGLTITIQPNGAQLDFVYKPVQKDAYETFKGLPMLKIGEVLSSRTEKINSGKKRADVQKLEEKSTLNTELSKKELDFFDVPTTSSYETEFVRGYFYVVEGSGIPKGDEYIDCIEEVLALYPKFTLGFWQDKVDQKFYPTREFEKLMADNGYPFLRVNRNFYIYYNDTAKKAYFVGTGKYNDKYVLNAHLAIVNLGKKSSALQSIPRGVGARDYKAYFKALDREEYELNQQLDRITKRLEKALKAK